MAAKKNGKQGQYDEIEFSQELADSEDKEAMARMDAADQRVKNKQKKNK
ncbi:YfhD family protein [Halalkalibacter akibai]|nr:YfhD family protein [Halalkalibacter akibai]